MGYQTRTVSKHFDIAATTAGTEVTGILGNIPQRGSVDQVIIRATSGGGTHCDVQLRYVSGSSNREDLVYDYTTAPYPLVDSSVNAPLDTAHVDGELILFLQPQVDGQIKVRIDFLIH